MKKQLIILDRDGVINLDSVDYIKSPDEWQAIPGSLEAITTLKKRGFLVAIASNQSGIGRQYYSLGQLARIHNKLHKLLLKNGCHIDGVFFCPHTPDANCLCRKPLPGLIHSILSQFNSAVTDSLFIGDSQRDIEAANSAKIEAILVRTGNGAEAEKTVTCNKEIRIYDNLQQAVNALRLQDS